MNLTQVINLYSGRINENSYLKSILYDLDLLPEQVEDFKSAYLMGGIVESYEQGFRDGIEFITKGTEL